MKNKKTSKLMQQHKLSQQPGKKNIQKNKVHKRKMGQQNCH